MFDVEVTLLSENGFTTNEIGDKIPLFEELTILGYEKPISRYEFYNAGQNGIELSKLVVVHSFEYNQAKTVIIDNVKYSVVRVYKINNEETELSLKVKAGNQ